MTLDIFAKNKTCEGKKPRECESCKRTKQVHEYDQVSAGDHCKYKKRCRSCEFPTCASCKAKYAGRKKIVTGWTWTQIMGRKSKAF